ncbi:transcription initiation factor tfiid subunit [Anaeramoeba flamelloides]|uniref:Transcription initiation factor tfiid subunit n=1 Tax=Anaeramoeba flamelloides TaxID=1746091 RepID=A0AAV7ZIB9_9EUKA|nr:transcription initiation factor tfiid subunit [Anaeramoeba flamelloides]
MFKNRKVSARVDIVVGTLSSIKQKNRTVFIKWTRGKHSDKTQNSLLDKYGCTTFNQEFSVPCTLFFEKKTKNIKRKKISFSIILEKENNKKKLTNKLKSGSRKEIKIGKIEIDVTKRYKYGSTKNKPLVLEYPLNLKNSSSHLRVPTLTIATRVVVDMNKKRKRKTKKNQSRQEKEIEKTPLLQSTYVLRKFEEFEMLNRKTLKSVSETEDYTEITAKTELRTDSEEEEKRIKRRQKKEFFNQNKNEKDFDESSDDVSQFSSIDENSGSQEKEKEMNNLSNEEGGSLSIKIEKANKQKENNKFQKMKKNIKEKENIKKTNKSESYHENDNGNDNSLNGDDIKPYKSSVSGWNKTRVRKKNSMFELDEEEKELIESFSKKRKEQLKKQELEKGSGQEREQGKSKDKDKDQEKVKLKKRKKETKSSSLRISHDQLDDQKNNGKKKSKLHNQENNINNDNDFDNEDDPTDLSGDDTISKSSDSDSDSDSGSDTETSSSFSSEEKSNDGLGLGMFLDSTPDKNEKEEEKQDESTQSNVEGGNNKPKEAQDKIDEVEKKRKKEKEKEKKENKIKENEKIEKEKYKKEKKEKEKKEKEKKEKEKKEKEKKEKEKKDKEKYEKEKKENEKKENEKKENEKKEKEKKDKEKYEKEKKEKEKKEKEKKEKEKKEKEKKEKEKKEKEKKEKEKNQKEKKEKEREKKENEKKENEKKENEKKEKVKKEKEKEKKNKTTNQKKNKLKYPKTQQKQPQKQKNKNSHNKRSKSGELVSPRQSPSHLKKKKNLRVHKNKKFSPKKNNKNQRNISLKRLKLSNFEFKNRYRVANSKHANISSNTSNTSLNETDSFEKEKKRSIHSKDRIINKQKNALKTREEEIENLKKSLQYSKLIKLENWLIERILFFSESIFSNGYPLPACVLMKCFLKWDAFQPNPLVLNSNFQLSEIQTENFLSVYLNSINLLIQVNRNKTENLYWLLSNLVFMVILIYEIFPTELSKATELKRELKTFKQQQNNNNNTNELTKEYHKKIILKKEQKELKILKFKKDINLEITNIFQLIFTNVFKSIKPYLIKTFLIYQKSSFSKKSTRNKKKKKKEKKDPSLQIKKIFENLIQSINNNHLPQEFQSVFFKQIVYAIDVTLINELFRQKKYCTCGNGFQIKLKITQFEELLNRLHFNKKKLNLKLFRVKQASQCLAMNKVLIENSNENYKACSDIAPDLNLVQIQRLLKNISIDEFDPQIITELQYQKFDDFVTSYQKNSLKRNNNYLPLEFDITYFFNIEINYNKIGILNWDKVPVPIILKSKEEFYFLKKSLNELLISNN